jgi:hypothetical protein
MNFVKPRTLFGSLGILSIGALFLSMLLETPAHSSRSSRGDSVIVIGLDQKKRVSAQAVPLPHYVHFLSSALGVVNDSFVPALAADRHEADSAWQLRTIGIGLGLQGQLGLGPIIYVDVSSKVLLVFTNSKNPVYPD